MRGKHGFLKVISRRKTGTSDPSRRTHRIEIGRERLKPHSAQLFDHLSKSGPSGSDLQTVLDGMGPLLVKIMRADRGFIRLFDAPGSDLYLGVAGLSANETIGIAERAFMNRLLAGHYVRDGGTILAPIICRNRTIGFFCLDRHRVPRPFTDDEGHFLIGVGQALVALAESRADRHRVKES